LLRSNLEASVVEIKDLKHQIAHSSRYIVLSPPCDVCDSLKGKLFHATKENTELKQEVAYLTSCHERNVLSEKMIEEDLSWVEESATKSSGLVCGVSQIGNVFYVDFSFVQSSLRCLISQSSSKL
jgi:hypothetical protein